MVDSSGPWKIQRRLGNITVTYYILILTIMDETTLWIEIIRVKNIRDHGKNILTSTGYAFIHVLPKSSMIMEKNF